MLSSAFSMSGVSTDRTKSNVVLQNCWNLRIGSNSFSPQMKFIVFVQTAKQKLMLLILSGELWTLMKIHSWIFPGWTQVLISLVSSGFTADTACVTDYNNIG